MLTSPEFWVSFACCSWAWVAGYIASSYLDWVTNRGNKYAKIDMVIGTVLGLLWPLLVIYGLSLGIPKVGIRIKKVLFCYASIAQKRRNERDAERS